MFLIIIYITFLFYHLKFLFRVRSEFYTSSNLMTYLVQNVIFPLSKVKMYVTSTRQNVTFKGFSLQSIQILFEYQYPSQYSRPVCIITQISKNTQAGPNNVDYMSNIMTILHTLSGLFTHFISNPVNQEKSMLEYSYNIQYIN